MNKSATACVVVATAVLVCLAQELKPEDVLEGAAASAKSYLRDTTELPLQVSTTIQEFDSAGKQRKTRRDSHRFTIVQARPDEYKTRSSVSAGTFVFHHRSMIEQIDADVTAVAAGMLLRSDVRQGFDFQISRPGERPLFRVSYQSHPGCGFEINSRHLKLRNWCGEGEYVVEPGSYALQHFTFAAAHTPAPVLEGRTLRSYRVEETFQTISVPGVARPFVVPRTLTTTYEDEGGRTVLNSEFTLLPQESKGKDSP